MGWRFKWVSSFANDFNFDYHVSFTNDEMAKTAFNGSVPLKRLGTVEEVASAHDQRFQHRPSAGRRWRRRCVGNNGGLIMTNTTYVVTKTAQLKGQNEI